MDSSQLAEYIQNILSNEKWPMSLEEIDLQLKATISSRVAKTQYSPDRIYQDGDRLYHPAEAIHAWFTVKVCSPTIIDGYFDDGMVKTFIQGDEKCDYYTDELSAGLLPSRKVILDTLNNMEDLLRLGNLYYYRPHFDNFPLHQVSSPEALEIYINHVKAHNGTGREESSKQLRELCNQLGFKSFCYIVHIDNLPSVMRNGILCNNLAPREHVSFANPEIQAHRHVKVPDPSLGFHLHDYTPLFFNDRPPLLYGMKDLHAEIAKIHISPLVLLEPYAIFSNMNARNNHADFYFDYKDLSKLNWTIIQSKNWLAGINHDQFEQNKPYRQTEAEIPLRVESAYFRWIEVSNQKTKDTIENILQETGCNIKCIQSDHFF